MQLFGYVDGGIVYALVIGNAAGVGRKGRELIAKQIGDGWNGDKGLVAIGLDERMRQGLILDAMVVVVFEKDIKKHRVLSLVGLDNFKERFVVPLGDIAISVLASEGDAIRETIAVTVLEVLLDVCAGRAKHVDVYRQPASVGAEDEKEAGATLECQRATFPDQHLQKGEGTDDFLHQCGMLELMR